LTAHHNI